MVIGMANAVEMKSYGDFTTGALGKIITDAVQNKLRKNSDINSGEYGISDDDLSKLKPAVMQFGVDSVYQFYMSLFPGYYDEASDLTEEQSEAAGKLREALLNIMKK